ncbi:MAG: hypothetical protein IJY65_02500 [Clostridia bacterium]|nr:hypothetical protein [Clostridia bacterium]
MKKKLTWITVLAILLIAVVLNVVLYLTAPENIPPTPSFKILWVFTFPVNFIFAILLVLYAGKKSGDGMVRIPVIYYIIWTFASAYFTVGTKLMYVYFETVGVVLAVEIVITAVYFGAFLFASLGLSTIEGNRKLVKEKVLFIRLLKADLESAYMYVTDVATREKLEKLAEKIRFSDPMSHPALAACENELSVAVGMLVSKLRDDGAADVSEDINRIGGLLEYRNTRCLALK